MAIITGYCHASLGLTHDLSEGGEVLNDCRFVNSHLVLAATLSIRQGGMQWFRLLLGCLIAGIAECNCVV